MTFFPAAAVAAVCCSSRLLKKDEAVFLSVGVDGRRSSVSIVRWVRLSDARLLIVRSVAAATAAPALRASSDSSDACCGPFSLESTTDAAETLDGGDMGGAGHGSATRFAKAWGRLEGSWSGPDRLTADRRPGVTASTEGRGLVCCGHPRGLVCL